jgi:L-asparaginase II
MSSTPLRVHASRGGITESSHTVHAIIVDALGKTLHQWGDVTKPIYPRSSIKALQAMAFMEMKGDEYFQLNEEEIAILCASHNGEPKHVETAQSILKKVGNSPTTFECGSHWPMRAETSYQLARTGEEPTTSHNNCSGKHAGMIALAKLMQVDPKGYINIDHPVQQRIASSMAQMCEYDYQNASWSPDGCSAPTWAIPLYNLALGFAKFASPDSLTKDQQRACNKLFDAVVTHPFMVAGTERYCTDMMALLGKRVFLKVGAEGVYIAAIPDLKLAIALKCEDGATRAAESVMTALLGFIGATDHVDETTLARFQNVEIKNWNKIVTGDIYCVLDPA